jgi:hypothetical protein
MNVPLICQTSLKLSTRGWGRFLMGETPHSKANCFTLASKSYVSTSEYAFAFAPSQGDSSGLSYLWVDMMYFLN